MVLVEIWPFFQPFFFGQFRLGKPLLRYSRTKKRLSRLEKQEVQNFLNIEVFLKGLTHGFGPNMAIFRRFFFRHYSLGKSLLRYSRTKRRPSRL